MAKTTRALSGAAKDAFLENVVGTEIAPDDAAGQRVARHLKATIAQVRVRLEAGCEDRTSRTSNLSTQPAHAAVDTPFDPFTPNVVVTVRRDGREAALAQLAKIESAENLRLLAREQQLSIDTAVTSPSALCDAIVAAAERRVANRRAAAS